MKVGSRYPLAVLTLSLSATSVSAQYNQNLGGTTSTLPDIMSRHRVEPLNTRCVREENSGHLSTPCQTYKHELNRLLRRQARGERVPG